ncbi:hypothetical protein [Streptomyces sp. NPDC002671]
MSLTTAHPSNSRMALIPDLKSSHPAAGVNDLVSTPDGASWAHQACRSSHVELPLGGFPVCRGDLSEDLQVAQLQGDR